MQEDFAAIVMCIRELLEMFPPGQQAKVDQLRANIRALESKYEAGMAAWVAPDPQPPPSMRYSIDGGGHALSFVHRRIIGGIVGGITGGPGAAVSGFLAEATSGTGRRGG